MKFNILLTFLIFLTQYSLGQTVEDPCQNKKDRIWIKTDKGNQASLSISKGENRLMLAFSTQYFCIDKGADVIIYFTDTSSLSLRTINEFNCSSAFVYVYKKKNKEILEYLSSRNIETIAVFGVEKNVTSRVTKEEAEFFTRAVKCLADKI